MKRSEMINILIDIIEDRDLESSSPYGVALDILGIIEEEGMLPPERYVPRGPFETVECSWEPEEQSDEEGGTTE